MLGNDNYVEYAIKAKPTASFYVKLVIAIWVFFLGIPLLLFVGGIGMIVSIIGICLFCYFLGFGKVEYEYTFTNGSVEIAAIYNASKRKELMHFEMEQVAMIVPENSNRIEHEVFAKKRNYTSGNKERNTVTMVVELNGHKEAVSMELNDKCMEHIRVYAKNKIYDL